MRLLIAVSLLALTLAGCTAPEEEQASPLFGSCPQWIEADLEESQTLSLDGSDAATVFPEDPALLADHDGFPLDRYTIHFTNVSIDGTVELRAFADAADKRLAFTDYRDASSPHLLPFAKLDGGDLELDVFLTAVAHGTAPAPDALRLHWSGEGTGSVEYTIRASYRVCGVPL